MSRTYRNYPFYVEGLEYGDPIRYWYRKKGVLSLEILYPRHAGCYFYNTKSCRDEKPYHKSPRFWKKHQWARRKAKTSQAMIRENYESIPHFRTENDWWWC